MSTPVREQYLRIKQQHPDTILFFRLGDFYETFDDDARVVAAELEIVLTAREVRGARIPMAGVPHHAAEGYIAKLVVKGYKVAVCEQLTEPNGKDVVERRVVRVVTPGTLDEPSMLDARRNNFVAAVVLSGTGAGLAYADITTGEFAATQATGSGAGARLREELERLAPAEVIVPEGPTTAERSAEQGLVSSGDPAWHTSTLPTWRWKHDTARETLCAHAEVASLEAFGLADAPLAARAAGALLQYIQINHSAAAEVLSNLRSYSLSEFMTLDDRTRANLELTESSRGDRTLSLLAVLDHTRSPMGGRHLRQWLSRPLLAADAIETRLRGVESLVHAPAVRQRLRDYLKPICDLERVVNRAVQRNVTARELQSLAVTLGHLPRIRELAAEVDGFDADQVTPLPDLHELLVTAIADDAPATRGGTGRIRSGYSRELDALRDGSSRARQWIAGLERAERERTGIRTLKVGYNKVFGYYLEVSNAARELVPDDYIRKQTLVGAERYITPQLKEYESLIHNSQAESEELEESLYRAVVAQVAASAPQLLRSGAALAELDCLASLAEAAECNRYVRPMVDDGDRIHIVGGRHPVVEQRTPDGFVPNDTCLSSSEEQIVVLTGPNMAGKSTYLRQVALIVLMTQVGSYVPAESAHIGLVDRIFTRVGAQDDIASGQSTFMVEMTEAAYILGHCTPRSPVILDEIGRGTSTYDGLAIAQAVVEYLHNSPRSAAKTLFATHYHELNALADSLPRVRNYRMDVLEEGEQVVFLRRVVPGGADRSYGIHVARLAGLPKSVVRRAQELLKGLEPAPQAACGNGARGDSQLTFLNPDQGLLRELAEMDVESLTPIESLTLLYELKRRAASVLD